MRTVKRVAVVVLVVASFVVGHMLPVLQPSDSSTVRVDGKTCQVNDMAGVTGATPNTVLFVHC